MRGADRLAGQRPLDGRVRQLFAERLQASLIQNRLPYVEQVRGNHKLELCAAVMACTSIEDRDSVARFTTRLLKNESALSTGMASYEHGSEYARENASEAQHGRPDRPTEEHFVSHETHGTDSQSNSACDQEHCHAARWDVTHKC